MENDRILDFRFWILEWGIRFAICHSPSILRIQKSGRLTSGIPLIVHGTKAQ